LPAEQGTHVTKTLDIALHVMRRTEFRASVAEVAAACRMSPFELARLFSAALGVAPRAYMTRVRLDQAAASLVRDPRLTLADAAFDAGFESQQTFTRAFTRVFGMSPGRFREEGKMPAPRSTGVADIAVTLRAQKQLVRQGPMRVAGFTVMVDGIGPATPADAWGKLMPHLPVAGQEPGYSVGVCWTEPGGDSFTYMAGVVVADGAQAPQGLEIRNIPSQTYAIVRQHFKPGPFQPQFRAGLKLVWTERLPRMKVTPTGGPDFEVYPDDFVAGETAGWLEYRIPVED
jgi:AraC family transcriptional regulator